MVSSYPTFTSFSWVEGWSKDPRVLWRHSDDEYEECNEREDSCNEPVAPVNLSTT